VSGPFSLEGRVALVTGASAASGRRTRWPWPRPGPTWRSTTGARSNATCARVRALGRRAAALSGDITEPATPDRLVRETLSALGGLDIVVNNAGTIRRAPAAETSDEDWLAVLDVNLNAVYRVCRAAGRHMLAQGRGKIVNVASLLAFQGGILVPATPRPRGASPSSPRRSPTSGRARAST